MNEEERGKWLEERRLGIGASDAPVVCGVSEWKSPYELYLDKLGLSPEQQDNEPMYWGRALETPIRVRAGELLGRTILVPPAAIVSKRHPFMRANLDGFSKGRVFEAKTARSDTGWGDPGTDQIPDAYLIQVQHQLIVTEVECADVAVLVRGSDFRLYEVPADKELQEVIIERESKFWDMVQRREPPAPTSYADVRLAYGAISKSMTIEANALAIQAHARLKTIKELLKEEEAMKAVLMGLMGEADTLVNDGQTLATWKMSKPSVRLDSKALKAALPEVFEQFAKEGAPSRRFLIK